MTSISNPNMAERLPLAFGNREQTSARSLSISCDFGHDSDLLLTKVCPEWDQLVLKMKWTYRGKFFRWSKILKRNQEAGMSRPWVKDHMTNLLRTLLGSLGTTFGSVSIQFGEETGDRLILMPCDRSSPYWSETPTTNDRKYKRSSTLQRQGLLFRQVLLVAGGDGVLKFLKKKPLNLDAHTERCWTAFSDS